jgi:hypothetical protein
VAVPVVLNGLLNGSNRVAVIGKNSAGVWQSTNAPTRSRTWTIDTSLTGVRINEILARNVSAVAIGEETPDLVELYNGGSTTVSLAGMGVSDNAGKGAI